VEEKIIGAKAGVELSVRILVDPKKLWWGGM
jgi:hypothetical protein